MYRRAILLLAIATLATNAFADTVTERSGRIWNGTIVSADESAVVIDTDDGLEIRIPRDRVQNISYSSTQTPPPAAVGQTFVGRYDDGGRVGLSIWGTGYGIANGIFLAALADGNEKAYALAMLTGGALGFGVPWIWSEKRHVDDARATLMTFGGSWGLWQGLGWPYALADSPSKNQILIPGIAAGLTGVVGAGILTADREISQGDAEMITSLPGWTSIYWLWLATIFGSEDGRFILGSTLLAGDIGVIGGVLLAPHVERSRNDIRLVNVGGLLGGLTGSAIAVIFGIDNGKVALSTIMGGSLIGQTFTWWALSPRTATAQLPDISISPALVRAPENFDRALPALGMQLRF